MAAKIDFGNLDTINTMSVKVGILVEFLKCGPYHALNHGRCTIVLLPYSGLEDFTFLVLILLAPTH